MQQLEGVSKNATAEDPFEASMGIYMFKRDVLIKILDRQSAGTDTKPDAHFGYDVIPHALEDGLRIVAHHHPGYWRVSVFAPLIAVSLFPAGDSAHGVTAYVGTAASSSTVAGSFAKSLQVMAKLRRQPFAP